MAVHEIRFRDLEKREKQALHNLKSAQAGLKARGTLTAEEQEELDRITDVLAKAASLLVDPLFVAVRDGFNEGDGMLDTGLLNHKQGRLKPGTNGGGKGRPNALGVADVVRVAHVLGILANEGVLPPRVTVVDNNPAGAIGTDVNDPAYEDFTAAFYGALGRARSASRLAGLVLPILELEGDVDGARGRPGEVDTSEFAAVMDALRRKGITETEPQQLRRRVNECLDTLQAVGIEKSIPDMSISIPDLNEATDYEGQRVRVEAFGPVICAAMLDELKAFEVVDKIVEHWQQGMLTIGVSDAGRMLYEYWKSTPNRMSDAERRNIYAMTLGIPGGSPHGASNPDFNDLWIRFASSVSSLVRQNTADNILRASLPSAISQQQVRKAARDLTLNLSAHGYGMVSYAARDLQDQIVKMIALLGHADIRRGWGADDMWQVIDHVATVDLGGPRNSSRYRTLATCGAIITKWLSQNIVKFNSSTSLRAVIDVKDVLSSDPKSAGPEATRKPTDYDLVNACELWLADTAVSDGRIEELSQPRESPVMTSRPIQIPAIAREIIDQAVPPGLGLGMGMGRIRH